MTNPPQCSLGRMRSSNDAPIWLDAHGRQQPTRACWTCGREVVLMRFPDWCGLHNGVSRCRRPRQVAPRADLGSAPDQLRDRNLAGQRGWQATATRRASAGRGAPGCGVRPL